MRSYYSSCSHTFTYILGNSLYIPLTSRCNSVTLVASRGPNFLLPASTVAALCRVRDAEHATQTWMGWSRYLDGQDAHQKMPDALEAVSHIEDSAERRPTVAELLQEVEPILLQGKSPTEDSQRQPLSVVFAGEGEPTLRLSSLLQLASSLKELQPEISLRLSTNGLLLSRMQDDSQVLCLQQLFDAGIQQVSVGLMTHHPEQYQALMQPVCHPTAPPATTTTCAHDYVCDFVRHAVGCGIRVEVTAVDRKEVDKAETERLASKLGSHSVRWRSYHP
jgi:hypothetical protein